MKYDKVSELKIQHFKEKSTVRFCVCSVKRGGKTEVSLLLSLSVLFIVDNAIVDGAGGFNNGGLVSCIFPLSISVIITTRFRVLLL